MSGIESPTARSSASPSPPPPSYPLLVLTTEQIVLAQAAARLRIDSVSDLVYFAYDDVWNGDRRVHGAVCRSGPLSGTIVVCPDPHQSFLIPASPVVRSVRANLADPTAKSLVDFPSSASRYALVPAPDGPVRVTFFKYMADGGVPALSALRSSNDGVLLSDRTLDALLELFEGRRALRDPARLPAVLAPLLGPAWQSMTFDLCGDRLPGVVRHRFACGLVPLWMATAEGAIFPYSRSSLAKVDQSLIVHEIAKFRTFPDDPNAPRLRTRGAWLCFTDDDGALIGSVYECTTNIAERERWRYFDAELESRVRALVQENLPLEELRLPPRHRFRFRRALSNFAGIVANPEPASYVPIDRRIVIVLCGFPGCGKSHFSRELRNLAGPGLVYVNQDELKRRDNCLRVASEALRAGSSALIDRTNISIIQRAFFLDLARDEGVANVIVVLFDVRPEVCAQRILTREDHPTLAATEKSVDILLRFINEFERPSLEEGFRQVLRVTSECESDDLAISIASVFSGAECHKEYRSSSPDQFANGLSPDAVSSS